MANQTVYPYGTDGSLPSSIGIINDLTTGGADKALSAQQGVVLSGIIDEVYVPDRNLYDSSTDTIGKYIQITEGNLQTNANYNVTDYIPVNANSKYCLTGLDGSGQVSAVGSNTASCQFYTSTKTVISQVALDTTVVTTPANAAYMRASVKVSVLTDIRIEPGEVRTNPGIQIPDESITYSELSQDVKDRIESSSRQSFAPSQTSETVTTSSRLLRLPLTCHIVKNTLLSANISGAIDNNVSLGVGVNSSNGVDYAGHWIELDSTNVKHYWWNGNQVLLNTYAHGLSLTQQTSISIATTVDGEQKTKLKITTDLGGVFEQELASWGVGKPYFRNGNNSGSLDVTLSFMPRDITKNIWLWGDSYVKFNDNERWPYYLVADKMTDFLTNSQPGINGSNSYADLLSVLELGCKPTILVWTLGMNGDNDTTSGGNYVIASSQKTVIDNVVSLCAANDITLILGTVPTVPSRQRTGFCNYVRSLGVRYIDFAAAVGATSSGVWNTGLLNTADNTHPTAAGAKVLAARALADCPELSIVE